MDNGEIKKLLTFQVENDIYAIDIGYVIDINRIQDITVVPHQHPFVKGVINLRGQIIPVIEMRARFNKEARDYDDRTCIVVVSYEDYTVGIIVDAVLEVAKIEIEAITLQKNLDLKSRFVQGITKINDDMITLMDIERLLFEQGVTLC